MADDARTFRRFQERADADELAAQLERAGFHPQVHDNSTPVDPLFVGDTPKDFHVLLPGAEFAEAERLLEREAAAEIERGVAPDHYLHGFTDDELLDLLLKPDEWSTFDRQLAKRILQERGIAMPDRAVDALRASRNRELQAPAPPQTPFIIVGYVFAVAGGLIGIAIGWYLNMSKKTLPDGRRVPVYSARDRRHGSYIFCLGLVMFMGYAALRTWRAVQDA